MKPEHTELLPSVFFNRMPNDAFKMSLLSVYLTVPLTDASAASRLALLQYVLRRGTRSYQTSTDITRRLEELYSADLGSGVFKCGENQVLVFSVGVLRREFIPDGRDVLLPAIELLSEMLFDPLIDTTTGVFLDEYVEREKKSAADRVRALQNNKASYARERCLSYMCADEPYGISELGTVEEIEKITPASLYAAYRALLAEARIDIYYTGTEAREPIVSAMMPRLQRIRRHPRGIPAPVIRLKAKKRLKIQERSAGVQGRLCIGFRTGVSIKDADAAAFTLFHCIFGGSPTSKLFVNVREKMSLCYSCASRLQLTKGIFMVSAGIENKNRRRAVREIMRQLARMRAGKITDDEFKMAVKTLAHQSRTLSDDPTALERWYFMRALFGVSETPEEFLAALSALTVRDVVRVAKKVTVDTVYFLRSIPSDSVEEEVEEDA